jgi:hypothetical protein
LNTKPSKSIWNKFVGRLKCICEGQHVFSNDDILAPTKEKYHVGKCLRCDYDLKFSLCLEDDTIVIIDEIF